MRIYTVLLAAAAVNGAALVSQGSTVEQQPLAIPNAEGSNKQEYRVRRYAIGTKEEKLDIIRLAKKYDVDIWSVHADSVDLYFGEPLTPTALPGAFATYNSSVFVAEWEHPSPSYRSFHTIDQTKPSFKPTANKKKNKKRAKKAKKARKKQREQSGRPQPYPHHTDHSWNLTSISNCTFHNAYHPYDEIEAFAQQLAEDFPHLVELIKLGRTSEDREILALNLAKPSRRKHRKMRMVIQGAQHAREWIASSTALYLAHSLVVSHADKASKIGILDLLDITVIPLPNPDGYAYTWDHDRLWYKNRSPIGDKCVGIDLNRNWGYEWAGDVEGEPCSNWYPGSHAFEAHEVSAIAEFINRTPNIQSFIDLRSYGQTIMYPFSYTCDQIAPDEENLVEAALGAAQALSKTHGTKMTTGAICELLYSAPGNAVDWMYGEAGIELSYSVMLRDTGTHGFLLPPKMIRPVGEEVANMIAYLDRWMHEHKF